MADGKYSVYWDDELKCLYWIEWEDTGNCDIPIKHYLSDVTKNDANVLELFNFLNENGGSLFKNPDGSWQYTIAEESREGRTLLTHGLGQTAQDAITRHHLYKSNMTGE